MQVTFDIPDKYTTELGEAIAKIYFYDPKSGINKMQFFKNATYSFWRNALVQYRANLAKDTAQTAAITETEDFKE